MLKNIKKNIIVFFILCSQHLLATDKPIIISLGYRCQVAQQLILNDLRLAAYPFDWLICSFDTLYRLLANDFEDFLNPKNLILNLNIPYEDDYGHFKVKRYPHVFDKKYGILFRHDFKFKPDFLKDYPIILQKYKRRIDRFYKTLQSNKPIYFIRHIMSKNETLKLLDLLDKKFPNLNFTLIVIDHNEEVRKPWHIPRVYNYFLPLTQPYNRDGDNEAWTTILKHMGLTDGINKPHLASTLHEYVSDLYKEE